MLYQRSPSYLRVLCLYWARQGRESIDAVVIFASLLSAGIWGGPFLREVMALTFGRRKPAER